MVAVWGLRLELPLPAMLSVLVCLIAFNISCHLRWHEEREVSQRSLFLSLLVDVGSLTAQLFFTGGLSNPFAFLYLLQVILAVVLLNTRLAWSVAVITVLCLTGLALFSPPLLLPAHLEDRFFDLYSTGLVISFALDAFLLVFFMTRIARNVRMGDAQLLRLREQATESEQVLRMGLLASGAAHELGTPLATMSVILGDWKHDPLVSGDAALTEELTELEDQLQRCKQIVTGILMSAGETRGEMARRTSLDAFLKDLLAQWQARRNPALLDWRGIGQLNLQMAADNTVRQMLFNVLDNALDASPRYVQFCVQVRDESIEFVVRDQGEGFAPDILQNAGRPYNSSKGRAGGGLGLFLVFNVARSLGGQVQISNRPSGGAEVVITLPKASLLFGEASNG
jgi:two-component system sensor histidine kinase RegB